MPDFNLHTHTARCRHAVGTDHEYAQAALSAGLKVLGFTDHCPFSCLRDVSDRMNPEEREGYLNSIQSLRQEFQGSLRILSGYEFEYFPQCLKELKQRRQETDLMILGQHYDGPGGVDFGVVCSDEAVLRYAELIEEALAQGLVDVLAHPDYFMLGRGDWSEACQQASIRICRALAAWDVPAEINLNGIRYGLRQMTQGKRYAYPWNDFWRIAADFHCRAVFGMDAHAPQQLTLMSERIALVRSFVDLKGLRLVEQWDESLLKKGART